ncbi:MAG TPA: nuclease-related domain-containing protein [Capsulimonadaceae bacterium]|nr:nuclease-related domain-containing protein [Capsulimonadaceae bacterium]
MQVVRSASIYEQRAQEERERVVRRHRFWPLWLVGGLLVIALISWEMSRSSGASAWGVGGEIAIIWVAGVFGVSFLSRLTGGSQGEAGERAALRALADLPDTYTAITNLLVPGFEKWGDVDILLIGPMGALVIEVKNFTGQCRIEGEYWSHITQSGAGLRRRSVSGQLRGYIKAVNAYLSRQGISCPVSGLIAINSNAWLQIAAPPPFPLVPYDRLKAHIELMPQSKRPAENDRAREALCSAVTKT